MTEVSESVFLFAESSVQIPLEEVEINGDNPLVTILGCDFFLSRRIPEQDIPQCVESIRSAVEDGTVPDQDLIEALKMNGFSMLLFLISISSSARSEASIGAKCLAFSANIYEPIWSDFMSTQENIAIIVTFVDQLFAKIKSLSSEKAPERVNKGYLGYDIRDKKDYNIEGYEDEETLQINQQISQQIAEKEEYIMIMLLILTQLWHHKVDLLEIMIENYRDSRDNENHENIQIIKLLTFAKEILILSISLSENAFQQCIKLLVLLNSQFSLFNKKTEIAMIFIEIDHSHSTNGILQQGILYFLNENNYPNCILFETIAIVRFCSNILYVGKFYSNDLKVLMEIILRELTNIPLNQIDYENLRIAYLNLFEDILSQTDWHLLAENHTKLHGKEVLQVAQNEDSELCKMIVEEIMFNHANKLE